MPNRAQALADDPRTTVVLLVLAVLLTGSSILSIAIVDDGASAGGLDGSAAPGGMDHTPLTDDDAGDGDGGRADAERPADGRPGDGAPSPGASPPTTSPSQAPVEPAAAEPGAPDSTLTVTRPGTYQERITTTSSDGSEDSEDVLLIVEQIGGGADDVRMRHRRESDGEESGPTQELAWRPDGVYLLSTTVGQGGFEIHCEHDPPLLQSPRSLQPGAAWEGEDTCEFDTAGGGTIHFRYQARVREAASIMIAGTTVSTWLIDTVTDVDVTTAFGSFSQHSEGPVWVDPSRGLTVRSEDDMTVTSDQSQGGGAQHQHVVRELLTLEPR